jgi:hypothetical protein
MPQTLTITGIPPEKWGIKEGVSAITLITLYGLLNPLTQKFYGVFIKRGMIT